MGYLRAIDIHPQEASKLFFVLDGDGSGHLSVEEFLGGCLRLQCAAKAVDLASFLVTYKQFSERLEKHANLMENELSVPKQAPSKTERARATQRASLLSMTAQDWGYE